jgi:hypothetical protein
VHSRPLASPSDMIAFGFAWKEGTGVEPWAQNLGTLERPLASDVSLACHICFELTKGTNDTTIRVVWGP